MYALLINYWTVKPPCSHHVVMYTVFVGHHIDTTRLNPIARDHTTVERLGFCGDHTYPHHQRDGRIRVFGLGQPRYRCVCDSTKLYETVQDTIATSTLIDCREHRSARPLAPFTTGKVDPSDPRHFVTLSAYTSLDSEQTHAISLPFCGDVQTSTHFRRERDQRRGLRGCKIFIQRSHPCRDVHLRFVQQRRFWIGV